MVALDDWSDLLTIDYNGGLGGEFFGLLLHDAIYKNTKFQQTADNKFNFIPYDVFTLTDRKSGKQAGIKKLYYFKQKYYGIINNNEIENKHYEGLYNKIFKDTSSFNEQYRNYIYETFSYKFDGGLKIALFHENAGKLKHSISIQEIFPKSKNIMLVCPDHYIFFAKFLMVVKVVSQHALTDSKEELKEFINDQYHRFIAFELHDFNDYPCLKIDMFSFLHEDRNYDKELSELLGQDIVLDKEKIKEYAQKNIAIFNQHGLDINSVYSKEHFKDKLESFLRKF